MELDSGHEFQERDEPGYIEMSDVINEVLFAMVDELNEWLTKQKIDSNE